jgi:indoleamine 2,3-dioxygenase
MRNYMPGPHRDFLNHISTLPESSIREYAINSTVPEVVEAFNFAVAELARFRDIHIGLITKYIIIPSKQYSPTGNPGLNLAVASAKGVKEGKEKLHGTGGTDLLPFLKQSRDETKEARVDA